MNRLAAAAIATAMLLSACSSSSAGPSASPTPTTSAPAVVIDGWISVPIDPRSVSRTVLKDDKAYIGETPCEPKAGYDDLTDGAQVTITNEKGDVVALGKLEAAGLWADDPEELVITSDCRFNFVVTVPAGSQFYGVEITHRGVVRYSAEDLKQKIRLRLT